VSDAAHGTAFTVLLPPSSKIAASDEEPVPGPGLWKGSGTVLVVDDEEGVRQLAKAMVERCGFGVELAADGEEAVRIFARREGRFACVLLDMSMPRLGGEETLGELRRIRADVPVILSSGYPEQRTTRAEGDRPVTSFIQKPYRLATLTARLREATEPPS
jgi:two-component system cell cycle sensor histidine kinase/response regulator CckA